MTLKVSEEDKKEIIISKKTINFIELFLKMDDMNFVSLLKHDVKILYDYYKNAICEINRLENEIKENKI